MIRRDGNMVIGPENAVEYRPEVQVMEAHASGGSQGWELEICPADGGTGTVILRGRGWRDHFEAEREAFAILGQIEAEARGAAGVPSLAVLEFEDWSGPDPDPARLREVLGARGDWDLADLGGRDPIVVALPPGWTIERLSANEAWEAIRDGLPVLSASAHWRWKIRKNQGALIRDPDGRLWVPPRPRRLNVGVDLTLSWYRLARIDLALPGEDPAKNAIGEVMV